MMRVPFVECDFCDIVTFTFAGTAFLLCLYIAVGL
jgi:hypothetical protein